jgi:uncharacterized protein (DUF983 family)
MTVTYDMHATGAAGSSPARHGFRALVRGARLRCPNCGTGRVFGRYLKVVHTCDQCGEALHHQRADDAPAYFTMLVVGHAALGGLLAVEQAFQPDSWVQIAVWSVFTVAASLWLLPRIKGALIAHQWALRMHGFGEPAGAPSNRPPDGSP